jgi:hypothetical protein
MGAPLTREERDEIIALTGANAALCLLLGDDAELLPFLLKDVPGTAGERLRALTSDRGAVVTKDIPPYAVAIGVPARVIPYR